MRVPFKNNPPPRTAVKSSSVEGFRIAATIGSPRSINAAEMQNSGIRLTKAFVPSMGSTIQTRRLASLAGSSGDSSESQPSRGNSRRCISCRIWLTS